MGVQEQTDKEEIIPLEKMGELMDDFDRSTIFNSRKLAKLRVNLKDPLLKFVDGILNDQILAKLLWYQGYTPQKKEFLGLPLHKNKFVGHDLLSKFRTSLNFSQITNLVVYILHHVKESGILDNCLIHGVDSTELFNENTYPLFTVNVEGKK
ncbi:MAG: hypothetical protein GY786_21165 [Proteobacteria bacterium]|nr:hypothetical protein [Pseudomonadota bacterium]